MGIRFRKSIKVAPGVKVNLGKKSAGISFGGKYGGMSFNTKSGARARASAPGTGISYSTKIGGSGSSKSPSGKAASSGTGGNGGGCLLVCLKIILYMMLAALLIDFGWIAGIIWFIFYRKKLNDDPEKQKKMSVLVAIGSVLSFIVMVIMTISIITAPPTPEAITLSINAEGQQLEIGEEYILTADVSPSDASTSSIKFVVDRSLRAGIKQDTENPTQALLHTQAVGTINIHAESGDIKSNTLTLEIINHTDDSELQEIIETEDTEKPVDTEIGDTETENTEIQSSEATIDDFQKADTENETSESTNADGSSSNNETEMEAVVTPPVVQNNDTDTSSNFNTYNNESQQQTADSYILNTSTRKIHLPSCKSVAKIAPQNYSTSNLSIEELESQGYTKCGNCLK